MDPDIRRKCRRCGREYHPTSSRQQYCNQTTEFICAVCGHKFEAICGPYEPKTCSQDCQTQYTKALIDAKSEQTIKKCALCGKEFHPKTVRSKYCEGPHYKECCICGKLFEVDAANYKDVATCSIECKKKLSLTNRDIEKEHDNQRRTLLDRYGVTNPMFIPDSKEKIKETNKKKYGADWYTQTEEYKERVVKTSLDKYGVVHPLKAKEVIEKRNNTNLAKYGWDNMFRCREGQEIAKQSMLTKYGVSNPSQVPELKSKATKSARTSKLELRICSLLDNYEIEYKQHYIISNDNRSHEFDFYLPKYNLLIDADGLYYHSYLDDPDGKHVLDYYDEVRLSLVPQDHIFHVVVEGDEETQIKDIIKVVESCCGDLSSYDSIIR